MDKIEEVKKLNNKLIEIFIQHHLPYYYWNGDVIKANVSDIVYALEQLGFCECQARIEALIGGHFYEPLWIYSLKNTATR